MKLQNKLNKLQKEYNNESNVLQKNSTNSPTPLAPTEQNIASPASVAVDPPLEVSDSAAVVTKLKLTVNVKSETKSPTELRPTEIDAKHVEETSSPALDDLLQILQTRADSVVIKSEPKTPKPVDVSPISKSRVDFFGEFDASSSITSLPVPDVGNQTRRATPNQPLKPSNTPSYPTPSHSRPIQATRLPSPVQSHFSETQSLPIMQKLKIKVFSL